MIGRFLSFLCMMGYHRYRYFPVPIGEGFVDVNLECTRCHQRHPDQWWETLR